MQWREGALRSWTKTIERDLQTVLPIYDFRLGTPLHTPTMSILLYSISAVSCSEKDVNSRRTRIHKCFEGKNLIYITFKKIFFLS